MSAHVEIRFLLARKARVRQIFCGGAAAHRDIDGCAVAEPVVGFDNRALQILRQCRTHDRLAIARPRSASSARLPGSSPLVSLSTVATRPLECMKCR